MGEIINFRKILENSPDDLITSKPWEFRRPKWKSKFFIQVLKSTWKTVENQGEEIPGPPPSSLALKSGMADTILGLYIYRENTERMREVYYLAGLIDCLINQTNPLLRTDRIGEIYNKITTLKKILAVHWHRPMDQVLFEIDSRFYKLHEYRLNLSKALSMEELYGLIREGTDEMFYIFSSKYIFFTPGEGV